MARIDNLKNYCTDIAEPIRILTGKTGPIKASEFDTEIYGIETGITVDGIIEQYKVVSGGNVNAGDFVKFINELEQIDTPLSEYVNAGDAVSAVLLSNNKVFIAHSYDTNHYLYGIVCTVNGTTITKGTDTQLSNIKNSGYRVSVAKLSESKVFIGHSYDSNRYLYGIACSISGSTITKGTDKQLSTSTKSGNVLCVVTLSTSKVFIAHSYDTNAYLYGITCTVSGTSVTKGTDTQLSSSANSGSFLSAVSLSSANVLIAHGFGSNRYLYGMVCTINGTTITAGNDIQLSTAGYSGRCSSLILISSNKVFIAHSNDWSYNLCGALCTISGTNIVKGTDTLLSAVANAGVSISASRLNDTKIFIAHSYNPSTYELYGTLCTINGANVIAGSDTHLSDKTYSGDKISVITLSSDFILICHSSGSYLNGMLCTVNTTTGINQVKNSFDKILGVAETTGTGGQTINVKVPKGVS